MAEYFMSPNVQSSANAPSYMAHAGHGANAGPAALGANVGPAAALPAVTLPAPSKHAGCGPAAMYGHPLSADAILVLFILLVIVTRLCG